MRIYSTQLLAAVVFIDCLSRYPASGSKTARPDVPSVGHPDGHADDISDDIAQRNDEDESEARIGISPGEILAFAEKSQAMKRPESSRTIPRELDLISRVGKASPELSETVAKRLSQEPDHPKPLLDLISGVGKESPEPSETVAKTLSQQPDHPKPLLDPISRMEKEQAHVVVPHSTDIERIIEELKARADLHPVTDETWTLLKKYAENDKADDSTLRNGIGGFTELAIALRKAKAKGLDKDEARAVEIRMLSFLQVKKATNEVAFNGLGLKDVIEKEGLTNNNLALWKEYIDCYKPNNRGNNARLDSSLLYIFRGDEMKVLQIIADAEEGLNLASMMLNGFIRKKMLGGNSNYRVKNLVKLLLEAKMSASMIHDVLEILRKEKFQSDREGEWKELTSALQNTLASGWDDAVKKAVREMKPRKKRETKRKANTALTLELAPARKKRAPRGQKRKKPSIRR
uniref:RxLR effector candidate protein n=1 Tax=Peronospora matthiolae TaxID=2874970 RepID=A0AAV1U9B8_9STRA